MSRACGRYAGLYQLHHGGSFDIVLDDPFVFPVHGVHPGDAYSGVPQSGVIPKLCFDLIAEGIIIARLVMDLLDHHLLSFPFRKIRISAFALTQLSNDPVGYFVYP